METYGRAKTKQYFHGIRKRERKKERDVWDWWTWNKTSLLPLPSPLFTFIRVFSISSSSSFLLYLLAARLSLSLDLSLSFSRFHFLKLVNFWWVFVPLRSDSEIRWIFLSWERYGRRKYVQISTSDSSVVGFQRYRHHHEQMDLPGFFFALRLGFT